MGMTVVATENVSKRPDPVHQPHLHVFEHKFGPRPVERTLENLLISECKEQCARKKLVFEELTPIQKKFITHYRCSSCKLLPLYFLNLEYPKRVKCGACGNFVAFRMAGKYGKLRKAVAFKIWNDRVGQSETS